MRKHTDHGLAGDVPSDGVPEKSLFAPNPHFGGDSDDSTPEKETGEGSGFTLRSLRAAPEATAPALDAPPRGREGKARAAAEAVARAEAAEAEALRREEAARAARRRAEEEAEAAAAAAAAEAEAAARAEEEEEAYEFEEFNPYLFIKLLPPYRDVAPRHRRILLPAKSRGMPKVNLVLDLDETLVHCSIEPIPDADLRFPVAFNGATYQVYVRKRPYVDRFLRHVASRFEVTIFTASQRVYAEKLLDLLDPRHELIHHRLYREACLNVDGNYLKDLTVLGRDLTKTILVDNSPHAFGYQIENGIPIESWFDDPEDTELLKLRTFLDTVVDVDDVRPALREKFRVHELVESAY